jgi:hypothetical protein
MKRALLSLMAIAFLTPAAEGAGSKQSADLSVVTTSGSETKLTETKDLTVKFWLQQLVLSALYRNVVQDSTVEEWQRQVNALPRISCEYPVDTKIAIPERQTLTFAHLLVPLSGGDYPAYIYLRQGDQVLRLAKYDPWVFQKLMVESGLAPSARLTAPRFLF